jgi:copper transport protein
VGWGYGVVRLVWFAALIALVGLVASRRWVWTPALRAAGLGESPIGDSYRTQFRRALFLTWAALALSGALMILFQASTLSGLSLWSAARPDVLGEVLRTSFGHIWLAQMALTALLLVPVVALGQGRQLLGWSLSVWIIVVAAGSLALCIAAGLNGHARTNARPALAVLSIAAHLFAVGVWVGGLGALVLVGGPAWRRLAGEGRPALLRQLVHRFSRVAIGAVLVVILTGVVNSLANLASVSDLWRVVYGRVLLAKIIVLAAALALAARHLRVVPGRLARSGSAVSAARGFQRTAAAELGLLVVVVSLAAALVALVPGRSVALAAKGPVNQEKTIGTYTAQFLVDPTAVGANQVHVTFLNAQGLGAAEVTNSSVTLGRVGAAPNRVPMRLISPGHFVGDVTLPAPGDYRVTVVTGAGASATFQFRLQKESAS